MGNLTIKEALLKTVRATKEYVDSKMLTTIISKTDTLITPEVSTFAASSGILYIFENIDGLLDYDRIFTPKIKVNFTNSNNETVEMNFNFGLKDNTNVLGPTVQVFSDDDEYYMTLYFDNFTNINDFNNQVTFSLRDWNDDSYTINNIEWKDYIELKDVFATKEYVDDKAVQGDWNEIDTNNPAYIKNKPFYLETERKTLVKNTFELNGSTTIDSFDVTEDTTYTIIYNGITYECTPIIRDIDGGRQYILGNYKFYDNVTDTGEPFAIEVFVGDGTGWEDYTCITAWDKPPGTMIDLEIIENCETIVKLDEIFLPDNIATKEYVDEADEFIYNELIESQNHLKATNSQMATDLLELGNPLYQQQLAEEGKAGRFCFNIENDISDYYTGTFMHILFLDSNDKAVLYRTGRTANNSNMQISISNGVLPSGAIFNGTCRLTKNKIFDENMTLVSSEGQSSAYLSISAAYNTEAIVNELQTLKIKILLVKPNFLTFDNKNEFVPTSDYHPATKKYVDDHFITDIYEDALVITAEEMNSSNNGGRGIYIDKIKTLEPAGFNVDFMYYGYYKDAVSVLTYSAEFNMFYCHSMDKNGSQTIGMCMGAGNGKLIPFNNGTQDVKDYQFTEDLIIKKRILLSPNTTATKKYVDDNVADLQGQIDNLFQNVSNGKELIASAITDKGIYASGEETFQELSDKISSLIIGAPGTTIVGYIDEENDIYISQTEVAAGSYVLKYEDQNGVLAGFDDIGNVEVE